MREESKLIGKELESDNEAISADNITDQKLNDDIRHSIKKDAFFGAGRPASGFQAEDSYFFGIDRNESSRHSLSSKRSKLVSPQQT